MWFHKLKVQNSNLYRTGTSLLVCNNFCCCILFDCCSCGSTSVYNTSLSLEKKNTLKKKNTCIEYRIISLPLKKLWTQDWNTLIIWWMISQAEGLVTDILNTYVLAVMLTIKGWNFLNTEELTSVQTKDDFCTYCQNFSKLQWLLLTPSLPQSHKSIKVPLTNNYNTSRIIFYFYFGGYKSHIQ